MAAKHTDRIAGVSRLATNGARSRDGDGRSSELLVKLIPGACLAVIGGLIWFALRLAGSPLSSSTPFIGALGGSFVLLSIAAFASYSRYRAWRESVWQRTFAAEVTARIGIERIYQTLDEARADIIADIGTARSIRLFLQLGRYMLGGPHSLLYEELAGRASDENAAASGVSLRVLHASPSSPFLSADRLRKRGSSLKEIQASISHLRDQLLALRDDKGINLERREHSEPYLWRLLFFDDAAYVSGYLFDRKNDERTVVYRVIDGDRSLYRIFNRYFEYLWEKYPPTEGSLSQLIPSTAVSSAAVLVKQDGQNLFMVFNRAQQEVDGRIIYRVASIGGKKTAAETLLQCAEREAAEETSSRVIIEDAKGSIYMDLGKRLRPIQLKDRPVPLGIIETPDEATGVRSGWGKRYTAIYLATLEGPIKNRSEVRGLLRMSDALLTRLHTGQVTFSEYLALGGSFMGDKLPKDAILQPYGAAELLALLLVNRDEFPTSSLGA